MAVLSVSNLSKKFSRDMGQAARHGVADILGELAVWRTPTEGLSDDEFWALRDGSFEVSAGGEDVRIMAVRCESPEGQIVESLQVRLRTRA